MTLANVFGGVTIGTAIGLIYLFMRVFGSAKEEGARQERIKGEIKGLQKQIDYLDKWREEHLTTCSSEHREISEKVDQVHEDISELKVAVASIQTWMQGREPRAAPPVK